MRFEKSADARTLEHVLSNVPVGDTITYLTLSQAIGKDTQLKGRSALHTARNSLLREFGIVFGVETSVGLVRLNDEQIIKSTEHDRSRIQRTAKKAIRKLETVAFEKLSSDRKRDHVIASAQLGTIAFFSGRKALARLEQKISNEKAIDVTDTLKFFAEKE